MVVFRCQCLAPHLFVFAGIEEERRVVASIEFIGKGTSPGRGRSEQRNQEVTLVSQFNCLTAPDFRFVFFGGAVHQFVEVSSIPVSFVDCVGVVEKIFWHGSIAPY